MNALLFHVSSFTIYYTNDLVIKAKILDFIASAYGKKPKVFAFIIYRQSTQQCHAVCVKLL
jgi:hypothetical protein